MPTSRIPTLLLHRLGTRGGVGYSGHIGFDGELKIKSFASWRLCVRIQSEGIGSAAPRTHAKPQRRKGGSKVNSFSLGQKMQQIISRQFWTGNLSDIRDLGNIFDAGIEAVVDLAFEERTPSLTRELIYCRFPLLDGAGNKRETICAAIETTATLIGRKIPTLIFCGAGMSRSPAIAAAAWALVTKRPLDECIQQIAKIRSLDLSPALWNDVETVYFQLTVSE